MIVIGIDPGLSGAIAFYDTSENAIEVHDMPIVEIVRNARKKKEVSAVLLSNILTSKKVDAAFVERVSAMPGQGVSSVFSFGRSIGIVEGVLAAYDIPTTLVTPQAWQKGVGQRAGKDGGRERAMQLFPAQAELFRLKKSDGRSDATLIAYYGAKFG